MLLPDDGGRPPRDVERNYSLCIYTKCFLCAISWVFIISIKSCKELIILKNLLSLLVTSPLQQQKTLYSNIVTFWISSIISVSMVSLHRMRPWPQNYTAFALNADNFTVTLICSLFVILGQRWAEQRLGYTLAGSEMLLFSIISKVAVEPTQYPYQRAPGGLFPREVKRLGY